MLSREPFYFKVNFNFSNETPLFLKEKRGGVSPVNRMLYEDGTPMLFEDDSFMEYEG